MPWTKDHHLLVELLAPDLAALLVLVLAADLALLLAAASVPDPDLVLPVVEDLLLVAMCTF